MTSLLTFFTSPSITHQLNVHVKAGFSEDSPHQDVIRAQSSFGNLIWKGWLGMLELQASAGHFGEESGVHVATAGRKLGTRKLTIICGTAITKKVEVNGGNELLPGPSQIY